MPVPAAPRGVCPECAIEFEPSRVGQKFCRPEHRIAFNVRKAKARKERRGNGEAVPEPEPEPPEPPPPEFLPGGRHRAMIGNIAPGSRSRAVAADGDAS